MGRSTHCRSTHLDLEGDLLQVRLPAHGLVVVVVQALGAGLLVDELPELAEALLGQALLDAQDDGGLLHGGVGVGVVVNSGGGEASGNGPPGVK